jgi:hypothetical protein
VSLVYIAGNLSDARKAEQVLNDRSVDFAISLDKFVTDSWLGRIIGDEYTGLFFSVPTNQHRWCRKWLEEAGLRDTVPLQDEHDIAGR